MNQKRLLNRNRANWLWSLSFVVVLLPFTLGQASVGGCGATVTVPPPALDDTIIDAPDDTFVDTDGDGFSDDEEINSIPGTDPDDPTDNPNNVRDTDGDGCSDYDELNFSGYCDNDPNTPVDSDGDGFSDDFEINSIPGTDPNDPTDNPNNVRDTDGDGCSNYDELNFPGFCDNDPYTPKIACDTTFYNAEFTYGFDLPSTALLVTNNVHAGSVFDAQWQVDYGLGGIWYQTGVQEVDVDLQGYGDDWALGLQERGATLTHAGPILLDNGDSAYLVMYTMPTDGIGTVVQFDAFVTKHQRLYMLMTSVAGVDYTEVSLPLMEQAVFSICVD